MRKTALDATQVEIDSLHRLLQVMTEGGQKARPIDLGIAQRQPTLSQLLQHVVDTASTALLTYLPNQQPNRERRQE
jgi:hypothetical protein